MNPGRRFAVVFGTRPEYLKLKPVIAEFIRRKYSNYKVIYVKQHEQLGESVIPKMIELSLGPTTVESRLNVLGAEILLALPEHIQDCTDVIVQGDTATAFYTAVCAFQLRKRIIHVEAGLRTYDLTRPFPEEAYRQMISRVANVHFAPHRDSSSILEAERVNGQVITVGNTILDLVKSYGLTIKQSKSVLITFHRRENWDKLHLLVDGLQKLIHSQPDLVFIWYLHPNPDLQHRVKQANFPGEAVKLATPTNHLDFCQQIAAAHFIITDSGGIQEEASFLGKHCIVLRASTERTHIQTKYITVLADYSKLDEAYTKIPKHDSEPCTVYGQGDAAEKIVQYLNCYEPRDYLLGRSGERDG